MFLIMLINFFGDDSGITFELLSGSSSTPYSFGFRSAQEEHVVKDAGCMGKEGFSLGQVESATCRETPTV